MQAELPLEYHAIYIAQKTLPNRNMPNPNLPKRKRRDAACAAVWLNNNAQHGPPWWKFPPLAVGLWNELRLAARKRSIKSC